MPPKRKTAPTPTKRNVRTKAIDGAPVSSEPAVWTVARLGAKSKQQRKAEHGDRSRQTKSLCGRLTLRREGVVGEASVNPNFLGRLLGMTHRVKDYNSYRSRGHAGRFEAGTNDRAVMVTSMAAYDELRSAIGAEHAPLIEDGDLGENILLRGPSATASERAGDGRLAVGSWLRIGSSVLEVTEANNPCYRFNTQPWAAAARERWGSGSPDGPEKWFRNPKCPLNNEHFPGVRGWLCRVVEEGEVAVGDAAGLLPDD